MSALHVVQRTAQQQLGEADDGVHRRADLVAHVGQEGAFRRRSALGALLGLEQLALHLAMKADVAGELDHLAGFAVGREDRVIGRLDPQLAAVEREPVVFAGFVFTAAEALPQIAIGHAFGDARRAEDLVMAAANLRQAAAEQVEKVLVGGEDVALQIELDHRHHPVDCRQLTGMFGMDRT
ncbi:hypothetical protein D3C80_1318110 [compost metagenome]